MKTFHIGTRLTVFAAMICLTSGTQAGLQYTVYDIGTFGGFSSFGYSVNNSGTVTGESFDTNQESHPFIYSGASISSPGSSQDLGMFGAGGTTLGYGINNLGQVVGTYYGAPYVQHAFIYTAGSHVDIGDLGGGSAYAHAINDNGQVTGTSLNLGMQNRAFRYQNGVMTDIGTLGGTQSFGYAINSSGVISGVASVTGDADNHAFRYSGGNMQDLGTFGGHNSYGNGINDAGTVAGVSWLSGNTEYHAFVYGTSLQDIGTPGENSAAFDVNNNGQVVGNFETLGIRRAFLYNNGLMEDLNLLATNLNAAGFDYLEYAYSINDSGWITGVGRTPGGEEHAFLAVVAPVPEPATGIVGLLCIGAALSSRCRARKQRA